MNDYGTSVVARTGWSGIAAGVAGAGAVVLGAFGAHALRGNLAPQMLDVWQTAVRFQFWHALALAVCALSSVRRASMTQLAAGLFAVGILLFCGSLYALALGAPRSVGIITPFGGLAFILGWMVLGVGLSLSCDRP